ncbi:homeobox and c2h2 transcription [Colletotrichum truncatum]|uniref:Homeobox and c2h2 transcription n=1 Tax=Colletotrichum truncatum TaxID=5467 RepID=A0ACC3Z1Q8_COLTU|nr:homeobox and C2H2 transcription protein [Colletotrichum truncatum]KAF6788914.1 homeobox and C2H2 transcription protein [Colletotrichum truncatum]
MDTLDNPPSDPTRGRVSEQSCHDEDKRATSHRPVVRHSRSSTRILKEWFRSHTVWPYPSQAEKESLSYQTGMSVKQISNWFVNVRRRSGSKMANVRSSQPEPLVSRSVPVDVRPSGGSELNELNSTEWETMTPLDRWQHTPPEEDPAPLQAIAQAAQQNSDTLQFHTEGRPWMITPGFGSSSSSFDVSSSDALSASSALSDGSMSASSSLSGFDSRPLRRRRRYRSKSTHHRFGRRNSDQDRGSRPYQCTFCTDTFKSRYDWTRHEGSLHLVLEKWTCLPLGPKYNNPTDGSACCILCDEKDPSDAHLETHDAAECGTRPPSAKTFFRKDHLQQHLRIAHGVSKMTDAMASWKSKMENVKSRCGFCGEYFSTWSERNDHLSNHFRSGANMKDWKGSRGLDPAVSLLVENAMPPYLIGLESADPDPFSASKGTTKKVMASSGTNARQTAPTSFESLTARLGDYVRIARENNLDLSDKALRRQSRLILYDDDDPWNQTPADNAQWLAMFKLGYGLNDGASDGLDITGQSRNAALRIAQHNTQSACSDVGPFTIQQLQQAAGCNQAMLDIALDNLPAGGNMIDIFGPGVPVPWSWQSPECLAEFRQLCQMPGISIACQPDDTDGLAVPPGFFNATEQGIGVDSTYTAQLADYHSNGPAVGNADDIPLDMTLLFDAEFET